jgi:hypothetical protein
MLFGRKISRKEALEISRKTLEIAEAERKKLAQEETDRGIEPCQAFLKYPKDKWRLMWVLDHARAEHQMSEACLAKDFCESPCGRWQEERVANIKRLAGIYPDDKNVESLRQMLERIRNMSKYEYEALCNSLPKEEE